MCVHVVVVVVAAALFKLPTFPFMGFHRIAPRACLIDHGSCKHEHWDSANIDVKPACNENSLLFSTILGICY